MKSLAEETTRRRWPYLLAFWTAWLVLYLWWPWLLGWFFPAVLIGLAAKTLIWGPPAPRRVLLLTLGTIAGCLVVVGLFALLIAATSGSAP